MAEHAGSIADLADVRIWPPADATLTDARTCGGGTPILLYDNIQITYQDGWANIDVDEKWASLARERGGRIETILGRPALVRSPETDLPNPHAPVVPDASEVAGHASVLVVVDGTLIGVSAKGDVPVEKLIELTNSIELPSSLQR